MRYRHFVTLSTMAWIWVVLFADMDVAANQLRRIDQGTAPELCPFHSQPDWSPDGKQLSFVAEHSGQADIWLMNHDGTNARNLTDSAAENETNQVWSPNGKWIAYLSTHDAVSELWIIAPDGTAKRNITPTDGNAVGMPGWSPDGNYLAVPILISSRADIWVIGIEDDTERNLTFGHGGENLSFKWPHWSFDGSNIAFTSFFNDRITIANADGSEVVDLLQKEFIIRAFWSPTSEEILFEYSTVLGGNTDIWKISADGQHLVNLTSDNLDRDFEVDWSPDGSRIVFKSTRNDQTHLWVMDSDGHNLIDVTPELLNDIPTLPYWSPTGDSIVFSMFGNNSSSIWSVKPDGNNLLNLSAVSATCDR